MRNEIEIGRPRHLSGETAHAQVQDWFKGKDARINDQTAATIASWWQGPVGHGLVFAGLCQSGKVTKRQDLIDACYAETVHIDAENGEMDGIPLAALADWARTYR